MISRTNNLIVLLAVVLAFCSAFALSPVMKISRAELSPPVIITPLVKRPPTDKEPGYTAPPLSSWAEESPQGLAQSSMIAFVYGTGFTTVKDDLDELVNNGKISGYNSYTEYNIDELWTNLDQYATLLIDEDCMFYWTHPDPGNPNPIPDLRYPIALSFYNHKAQLDQWIFNGGGLFSTNQNDISDTDEVMWTWLPDALQVRSIEDSSDPSRYGHDPDTLEVVHDPGLFSYPNQIDVTLVDEGECHGYFTHYPGYTPMVRDNVYGDVLEIYRQYGAGVVVLSHLEYETAHPYDVDYVENELHFILVSVNVTANYPNVNGKLDIYATAHCAIHGDLTDANTQLTAYDIRDSQNASTGIAGTLTYDSGIAKWKATDIDVSALGADLYTVLVSFEDIGGHTGSGTDSFAKGIGNAEAGVSSPYALEGDTVFIYATVWDDAGDRDVSGTKTVTAAVTGITEPLTLADDGSNGDLHQQDGEYSTWCELAGTGSIDIDFYVEGHKMDSTSLTIITDPELLVLTDIEALYNEFIDTGTAHGEDSNGNRVVDFYDLLDRLNQYARNHRGIVYDLSHQIEGYSALDYAGQP
jgi:hypothetical protein